MTTFRASAGGRLHLPQPPHRGAAHVASSRRSRAGDRPQAARDTRRAVIFVGEGLTTVHAVDHARPGSPPTSATFLGASRRSPIDELARAAAAIVRAASRANTAIYAVDPRGDRLRPRHRRRPVVDVAKARPRCAADRWLKVNRRPDRRARERQYQRPAADAPRDAGRHPDLLPHWLHHNRSSPRRQVPHDQGGRQAQGREVRAGRLHWAYTNEDHAGDSAGSSSLPIGPRPLPRGGAAGGSLGSRRGPGSIGRAAAREPP